MYEINFNTSDTWNLEYGDERIALQSALSGEDYPETLDPYDNTTARKVFRRVSVLVLLGFKDQVKFDGRELKIPQMIYSR